MTSCCHPHQMPWSGATGAIARGKRVSTGCGRKSRSVRVLRWICGVMLKPKAVNKPLPYFIVHELDKVRQGFVDGQSEEHTSELQSHLNLVCRLLLEKKKK